MSYKTMVVVTTNFEGMHHWSRCDIPDVMFLRDPHRHIFYVTVKMEVCHDDRDLEFFVVKRYLNETIDLLFTKTPIGLYNLKSYSCEMMGKHIIDMLRRRYSVNKIFCSVFEDNENGAEVIWTVD